MARQPVPLGAYRFRNVNLDVIPLSKYAEVVLIAQPSASKDGKFF
jgi:hypothetical protein